MVTIVEVSVSSWAIKSEVDNNHYLFISIVREWEQAIVITQERD